MTRALVLKIPLIPLIKGDFERLIRGTLSGSVPSLLRRVREDLQAFSHSLEAGYTAAYPTSLSNRHR
jgi:hypothetical protein